MYIPQSTYRLQLHAGFKLDEVAQIADYLQSLGVSTVYASPFFEATTGSTHGYDVTDPTIINPEIGSLEEFTRLAEELAKRNLGWLQDIVPNHMAFTSSNPWIKNILELGPYSPYFNHFDVKWGNDHPENYGKLMMPILGDQLSEVLRQQQIRLSVDQEGLALQYYDHRLPLNVNSYLTLLSPNVNQLSSSEAREKVKEYLVRFEKFIQSLLASEDSLPWKKLKEDWQDLIFDTDVRLWIQNICDKYNQDTALISELLKQQHYRLVHWQTTEKEIYYRRFFTVNDLICLNMQHAQVFADYHSFLEELAQKGLLQGVRVDHVDGLFDPDQYLEDLRSLMGPDAYIVVEKILEGQEKIPERWPIQGTSGYDFLVQVNRLFSSSTTSEQLTEIYDEWMNDSLPYSDLVYRNKMFILKQRMQGELVNLMKLLQSLEILPESNTATPEELQEALAHLLVAFPVYRIYDNQLPLSDHSLNILTEAFERAESQATTDLSSAFQTWRIIFNGVPDKNETTNQNTLHFIQRCQQFTGPLAAKGIEDTTFYQYNRLASRNEVGDSPDKLGVTAAEFHEWMQHRSLLTMNATATHDTKRGEDARMRINLLSEIPDSWHKASRQWCFSNEKYKTSHAGGNYPSTNDEYLLYQTMVGTFPYHISPLEENYESRLNAYFLKAIREAKSHSSWSEPNQDYEKATEKFIRDLLADREFMKGFREFASPVAHRAVTYSLGQTVLKTMVPGIPDVYQGTEFWDLSMVDPDNRRPVDYAARQFRLTQFTSGRNQLELVHELTKQLDDPAIKMYTLHRALLLRQQWPALFSESMYHPLTTTGKHSDRVLAFLRRHQDRFVIVVVPREVVGLLPDGQALPLGECWEDTAIAIPELPGDLWKDQFTDQVLSTSANSLALSTILQHFPVAILTNQLV